jgi:cadmium resistance protein CadD (predicted permease)
LIVASAVALSMAALRPALTPDAWHAALVGALLAAANAIAAYALVVWSSGRSNTAFFRAVLGGTLGRMAVLLAAVVAAILGLGLPRLPLVASLLGCFAAFLALELVVVHRRSGERLEARR